MKIFSTIILSFWMFLFPIDFNTDLSKNTIKKINKALERVWPGKTILQEPVDGFESVEYLSHLFSLKFDGMEKGYMAIASAPSRFDRFDYLLIVNNEFEIVAAEILAYREDYGGEIASPRWLKQFVGKKVTDPFKLNEDVVGISGATVSCRSASIHFKKTLGLLTGLNKNG
ncbi:MAG: FMN-binding protein [Cyclobacteriaceae bacterium]|nr:FMN-binding protein [Cyclobacteriaceae bacterium]